MVYGSDLKNSGWTVYKNNIYQLPLPNITKIVAFNGTNLKLVDGGFNNLSSDQWNWDNGVLYLNIGTNPNGRNIEVSQRNTSVSINLRDNIEISDINILYPNDSGSNVKNSNNIKFSNVDSSHNGNEDIKQYGASTAQYSNIIGNDNLDDDFSLHDQSITAIDGGIFKRNVSGIQNINSPQITLKNVESSDNSTHGFSVLYNINGVGGTGKILDSKFLE